MSDSAALARGANVRLNGILIGRVDAVDLSGESDIRRVVRVTMKVEASYLPQIPVDSIAAISAESVLASKFINIRRGSSPNFVKEGGELQSKDTSEFDEVVASAYGVMNALRTMLRRIDKIVGMVEAGEGTVGKLIKDPALYDNLNGTVAEARKITAAVNSGKGTLGKLLYEDAVHEEVRSSIARLDSLLDGLQQGQGTAGRLLKDHALYEEIRQTNAELKKVVADLNAGNGTAGKLLKDEELHRQIASTIEKLDSTLEKVNTGQGTLGQLLVNPQLYESLNGASREVNDLLKDFRANPKKFLSIRLSLF